MAKKPPEQLVMRKQPTIVSEDPFKTDRYEKAGAKIFEKAIKKTLDLAKLLITREYAIREMADPLTSTILNQLTSTLSPSALVTDSAAFVDKGYLQGVKLSTQALKALNISININLGDAIPAATLRALKDTQSALVAEWADSYVQMMYDAIFNGLERGTPLSDLISELTTISDKSILESKRIITDQIIEAARAAEMETLEKAGVYIFRWITVVDALTCEYCLSLNGNLYHLDPVGRGLVNHATGEFLETELEHLTPHENFIDPAEGRDGPPIHKACRCHFQPVLTAEQYSGTVKRVIAEV